MEFHPEKCQDFYFEDHLTRPGGNYDYVWCNKEPDVHRHIDFYEIFFFTGGGAYHYYNGEEREISKNCVFFLKPGSVHGLRKANPQSHHFSFFAKPEFFHRFFNENPLLSNAFDGKDYLMCEMNDSEYEHIFKIAMGLPFYKNDYRKVSLFLYNLISLLIIYNVNEQKDSNNEYVRDLVEKLNNFTYLTDKIQDIYAYYPIARCTLIKEFKNCTGMTIVQYQKKQKLTYALQMLLYSDSSIIEIAESLQFDSVSHFIRIFKEHYGITPKEYKKKVLERKNNSKRLEEGLQC